MLMNDAQSNVPSSASIRLLSKVPKSKDFPTSTFDTGESSAFNIAVLPAQREVSKRQLLDMAKTVVADYISPMYQQASQSNGGFVVVDRKFGDLPLLMGTDNRPVFVYEVVEMIEETLDFSELHSRLPTLSYGQIVGTVGFLRTLAQFNRKGVDIDALQDEAIEADPMFQEAVKKGVQDEETTRVLTLL